MAGLGRRLAAVAAALGLTLGTAMTAEAGGLWIASGTWPTEAECVYWKNYAVAEWELIVEPESNDCFRRPSDGYFYRIYNEF